MLYYVGAMQFVVRVIGSTMRFVLGTSAIESTGVAASIFLEGVGGHERVVSVLSWSP